MLTVFFVLAALVALQSLVALRDGPRFLAFVRKRLAERLPDYTPRVSLLVPCKGNADAGLEENLRALLAQDYPDYEVLFIVAEASDPACGLLEKLARPNRAREAQGRARVVVAGRAEGRGEKVNNLLAGIAAARADSEVFVFADSDGRPQRDWLRRLVAYLADPEVGAASTFRWYVPTGSFLSGLQSAWNAPAVTYMGEHKRPDGRPLGRNFCWGGGTAIRRTTFEEIGARRYWAGAVSDDYQLTEALRAAGKPIVFVPQALVATREEPTWSQLWEWTTRQILITRVYSNRLWRWALAAHLFYCGTFLFGLVLAVKYFALQSPAALARIGLAILATLAGIAALAVAKGAYRLAAVLLLLPEQREALRRTWWSLTLQAALVPWLLLANLLASATTHRLTWRGVTYELRSSSETIVLPFDPASRPGQAGGTQGTPSPAERDRGVSRP